MTDKDVLAFAKSVLETSGDALTRRAMAGVARFIEAKSTEAEENAKATRAEWVSRIANGVLMVLASAALVWATMRLLASVGAFRVWLP